MDEDFFDPPLSERQIVIVGERTRTAARSRLLGCESCDEDAQVPLDWVLDQVTKANPAITDYLMGEFLSCPACGATITEKTLVNWEPPEGS